MCAGLVGEVRRSPGGSARPRASSIARDRVLREPVDLQVGVQRAAARRRSRRRAGRGPRPIGEETNSARRRRARGPRRQRAGGGAAAPTKSRRSRLTRTGSRACGRWPPPSSVTSRAAGGLGERGALRVRPDAVVVAVHARASGSAPARSVSRNALDPASELARVVSAMTSRASSRAPSPRSPRSASSSAARCTHWAKKNSRNPRVVAPPVVALYFAQPSSVSSSSSNGCTCALGVPGAERTAGPM